MKYSVIIDTSFPIKELEQYYKIQNYFPDYECVDMYISESRKESTYYAYLSESKSDFLVVLGETNILNDVVKGMKRDIPILFVPSNFKDMRNSVSLFNYIASSIDNIKSHQVFQMNGEPFCFTASGGFSIPSKKEKLQREMYMLELLKQSKLSHRHMKLSLDNNIVEGDYVASVFSNTHFIEGYPAFKKSDLSDEILEITLIKDTSRLKALYELNNVINRTQKLDSLSFAEYYQAKRVKLELDKTFELPFSIDSKMSTIKEKTIEIEPLKKIRLMKSTLY